MDGYGPPPSKSPFGQSTEESKLIGRMCKFLHGLEFDVIDA
jgi:hypothetical protein